VGIRLIITNIGNELKSEVLTLFKRSDKGTKQPFLNKVVVNVCCLFLLASCANLNEGAIDYRKSAADINGKPNQLMLIEKYSPGIFSDAEIHKNNSISIHLEQAYIKEFFELANPFKGEGKSDVRGEIAVVARVREMKAGADNDFNFGPKSEESGRLVFYSDDVQEEQFLNLSYLPIYGPITYEGGPIAIQLYIMELDTGSKKLKPLLSTLAASGSQAYPPASPILNLLDTLGSALINGGGNDRLFSYSMVLMPEGGFSKLSYPILEAGNYVFVRKEDRSEEFDWEIVLDQRTGRLKVKDGDKIGPEFRGETYMTIQVQKGFDPTGLDLSQNTLENLLQRIDSRDEEVGENLKKITQKYFNKNTQIRAFNQIMGLLNKLGRMKSADTYVASETSKRYAAEAVERMVTQIKAEDVLITCKSNAAGVQTALEKCKNNSPSVFRPDQVESLIYQASGLVKASERDLIGRDKIKAITPSEKQTLVDALVAK